MASILIIVFVGLFLLLTGRFLYIQASGEIDGVSLNKWAKDKRTTSYTIPAERGKIFDSNGMVLAYDRPTFRMYAVVHEKHSENQKEPKHVVDPEKTAKLLAPILDTDETYILNILKKGLADKDRVQVEFGKSGKGLTQKQHDEIADLKLPGIHFIQETMRYYPNGTFASHIIGFARDEEKEADSESTDKIVGITGIEKEMNKLLSGTNGYISYERDRFGAKLLDPNEVIQKPKDGKNVYLTLDQKIQTLLEDVMTQVEKKYTPERMTAIVMNPKTGEILAMSNRPGYNPNNPANVENWYNDAISSPFEPGSTMKIFTWAAAIEEGVYNGEEGYKSGRYLINKRERPIPDHNGGQGWGTISFDEGFRRSSNVAAARLAWEKMGPDTYLNYLKRFDFDKKTGIDLPNEIPGTILYDYPIEKASTSFGQGSTITPIQQMKAATAVANGGKMLQPYVIKKIVDPSTGKLVNQQKPKVVGQPISADTAKQMLDLMESVVNEKDGTGKMYRLDDYSVAGKTGTAQIPNPESGGYMRGTENHIFSFLGMAPKNDPQLMMYVSVKRPNLKTDDGYEPGSTPVSFIFRNVMENGLHYMNIKPDKKGKKQDLQVDIPQLVGTATEKTKKELTAKGLHVTVIGKGSKVVAANVEEGSTILKSKRVMLLTDMPLMPAVINWSMRDVFELAELMDLKLEVTGNGYVTKQSIKQGKNVKQSDKLIVELKPPESNGKEKTNTAND